MATTIDHLGIDLLGNIFARLPAVDFASANAASSLFHRGCRRVLNRPKFSSACSLNPSLQVAVEEVVNKILSEPIRPQFAIASIGFDVDFQEAEKLITARMGSNFPIITHCSEGFMGKDALSEQFIEARSNGAKLDTRIMLTVGYLPGIEVKKIPLLIQTNERLPGSAMIDKFVTNIRDFSNSISGCNSPAAIIIFSSIWISNTTTVMGELDNEMSPKTVIVGGVSSLFENIRTDEGRSVRTAALALVFVKDKNKPSGIGETQFHCVSSSAMLPLGPAYEMASVHENLFSYGTLFTARRKGSHVNLNSEIILKRAYEKVQTPKPPWYTGVTKRRKCSIQLEKAGLMTSFAFHKIASTQKENICVDGYGLEAGDTFRLYLPDSTTALSSAANVLTSFKQGRITGGDKREVFGVLIFTSSTEDGDSYFGEAGVNNFIFLDSFPVDVTLGVTFCDAKIGRCDLTAYVKESQQHKSVFTCVNEFGAAYLILSYTP